MMAAWFQRKICRRASRGCPRHSKGVYFSMRLAGAFVPAAAHYFAVAHQHASDARVRARAIQSFFGKP